MYSKEWKTFGVKSGLTPLQYILAINRLHEVYKTPDVIKKTSASPAELKEAFGSKACLSCRSTKGEKLFMGVQYCHKANINYPEEMELVPFDHCGKCAPDAPCNVENIVIPKLGNIQSKQVTIKSKNCESTTTKDGKVIQSDECEYANFVQSYLPTIYITGQKKNRREPTSNEVNDWNSNLKIHGLWPEGSKVKSTLPFTPQARATVDTNAWPMIRIRVEKELYLHEWESHGIHSGLEPLKYVREINRLHKSHPTPDLFKSPGRQTISLAKLKEAFGGKACLLCRPKDGVELFLDVHYCHKVNSKTHEIGDEVPHQNCGFCKECQMENIIIPKIATTDKTRMRNAKTSKKIL